MRISVPVAAAAAVVASGLAVRVVRSRHRRFLHPDGRSFSGELEIWGPPVPIGAAPLDVPAFHPVTVRVSKGAGTRPGRADILGLAVRVPGPEPLDLLLSTAGRTGPARHVPVPRRSFDTFYGSILAYRTGTGRKIYLAAETDPDGVPLGRTLESVVAAAASDQARLRLSVIVDGVPVPVGRVTLGAPLPEATDAELAFDPIRNAAPDLHPTGAIHGSRALAYRLSQRWRGAADLD